ncbi:protein of unknown function [Shewanella benthica]|uniref:Uncharacterized protein n=1 Tax=Shewanella benthica TaxID=43661 RepID=A0A330M3B4_9GAMM|nr:protein of unknown function [Shewanella benthica]
MYFDDILNPIKVAYLQFLSYFMQCRAKTVESKMGLTNKTPLCCHYKRI